MHYVGPTLGKPVAKIGMIKIYRLHTFTLLNRLYGVWQRDCLPDTFVFKTLVIETYLYGFLVEYQDLISQKAVKNAFEPPSSRQTL